MHESLYGIPVITKDVCEITVSGIANYLGVVSWTHLSEPIPLTEYEKRSLSLDQRSALRFAPPIEVLELENPLREGDEPLPWIRSGGGLWTSVFFMLDGLVGLLLEYKHGEDGIVAELASGMPKRDEPLYTCAIRELGEEYGISNAEPIALADAPVTIAGRNSTLHYMPYIAKVPDGTIPGAGKPDRNEVLTRVLMPLETWIELLMSGAGIEVSASDTTFRALHQLGKINI